MNSTGIKFAALGILAVSFIGFFFGGTLPIPLTGKFFLGAFGFGTGVVLLIVAKILRIREYEAQSPHEMQLEHLDREDSEQE